LIFVRLPYLFDISAISKNAMKNILTLEQKRKTRAFSGRMNFSTIFIAIFEKKIIEVKKTFFIESFFEFMKENKTKMLPTSIFKKRYPLCSKKTKKA